MKHLVLLGQLGEVDPLIKAIMAKHGEAIIGLTVVQAVNVIQQPQPALKLLGGMQQQKAQVQFINIATVTILYDLPGEEFINIIDFLPEDQKEAYRKAQEGKVN